MSDDEHPSPARRAFYFVLGATIGGVIGYGFMSSSPGPAPSIFDPAAAPWVFGLAAVCGVIAAWSPKGFWRRSRK
jgi:ABC-type antimicrobial peptide transport system permease subunit